MPSRPELALNGLGIFTADAQECLCDTRGIDASPNSRIGNDRQGFSNKDLLAELLAQARECGATGISLAYESPQDPSNCARATAWWPDQHSHLLKSRVRRQHVSKPFLERLN